MELGGYWLNIAGILFLITGVIFFLQAKVFNLMSADLLKTLAGFAVGVALTVAGDRAFRRNMQKYGHPLIAGGFSILFITLCTAHFYFRIMNPAVFFLAVAGLVAWSGVSVFRYDSKLIGNLTLGALFLAPLFMNFEPSLGMLITYLTAISVGSTCVAYHKKWDYYLLVAFLGTYVLYFSRFQLRHPAETLAFLTAIYLLHLVSNNFMHFARKSSSDYNTLLSLVNPVVFAVTSYFVLLKMADNTLAAIVYSVIAVIHLFIARRAAVLRERDNLFGHISTSNLSLGVLFATAATSFVTYFSESTAYFSLVTILWFVQAFGLLLGSFRCTGFPECALVLRRSSWFCLFLASAQLFFVVPTMPDGAFLEKILIQIFGAVAYFLYFLALYRRRLEVGLEERQVMLLSVLAAFAAGASSCAGAVEGPRLHAVASVLCLLLLSAALRFDDVLGALRWLAALGAGVLATAIVFSPHGSSSAFLIEQTVSFCIASAAFLMMTRLVSSHRCSVPACEQRLDGFLAALSAVILLKVSLLAVPYRGSTFLWSVAALLLLRRSRAAGFTGESLGKIAQLIFFTAFLKSILFDANFVISRGAVDIAMWGSLEPADFFFIAGVIWCFFLASGVMRDLPEHRIAFNLLGLIAFAFHTTFILYNYLGILDSFQVILSGFWCCSSLLMITYGVVKEIKIFRLFGLVILIGSVLKICLVDIWVLNAYSRMTTFLILGGLLIATSFIYQSHREELTEAPVLPLTEGPLELGEPSCPEPA
jgi:hypothetical protein